MILSISAFFICIDVNSQRFSYIGLFQFYTLTGAIFCINLARQVIMKNEYLKRFFAFIGKNSLYILIFHVPAFKILSFYLVFHYNLSWEKPSRNLYNLVVSGCVDWWWWIVYAVMGITLPCLFVLLENKFVTIKQTFSNK